MDSQRSLEQHALRNVRSLVDREEAEHVERGRKTWLWVAILVLPALFVLVRTVLAPPRDTPEQLALRRCEVEKLSDALFAPDEKFRKEKPGISKEEISERRVAAAEAACRRPGR